MKCLNAVGYAAIGSFNQPEKKTQCVVIPARRVAYRVGGAGRGPSDPRPQP